MAALSLTARLDRTDNNTSWGFRMAGGKDFGTPLQIQRVTPGSLAAKCGVQTGDVITKIGSSPTDGLRHKEAQQCIILAGNSLELALQRGGGAAMSNANYTPQAPPANTYTPDASTMYGGAGGVSQPQRHHYPQEYQNFNTAPTPWQGTAAQLPPHQYNPYSTTAAINGTASSFSAMNLGGQQPAGPGDESPPPPPLPTSMPPPPPSDTSSESAGVSEGGSEAPPPSHPSPPSHALDSSSGAFVGFLTKGLRSDDTNNNKPKVDAVDSQDVKLKSDEIKPDATANESGSVQIATPLYVSTANDRAATSGLSPANVNQQPQSSLATPSRGKPTNQQSPSYLAMPTSDKPTNQLSPSHLATSPSSKPSLSPTMAAILQEKERNPDFKLDERGLKTSGAGTGTQSRTFRMLQDMMNSGKDITNTKVLAAPTKLSTNTTDKSELNKLGHRQYNSPIGLYSKHVTAADQSDAVDQVDSQSQDSSVYKTKQLHAPSAQTTQLHANTALNTKPPQLGVDTSPRASETKPSHPSSYADHTRTDQSQSRIQHDNVQSQPGMHAKQGHPSPSHTTHTQSHTTHLAAPSSTATSSVSPRSVSPRSVSPRSVSPCSVSPYSFNVSTAPPVISTTSPAPAAHSSSLLSRSTPAPVHSKAQAFNILTRKLQPKASSEPSNTRSTAPPPAAAPSPASSATQPRAGGGSASRGVGGTGGGGVWQPRIPTGPRKMRVMKAGEARSMPAGSGSMGRMPMCHNCHMQIRGPFVLALDKEWCPDHFVCSNPNCLCPLVDTGFVEEEGQLFCERDYQQYFAPRCHKCGQAIMGDCVNALKETYHPGCFVCVQCKQSIGTGSFHIEEGKVYCEKDWQAMFQTKCFGCQFPIEPGDRWVEALNENWHSECFNCSTCQVNLEGQSFFAKAGRPFCKKHAMGR